MSRPLPTIVGRDHELRDISAFLDRVEGGPSALVLEGPAGIGKTSIWSVGVREARDRGIYQKLGVRSRTELAARVGRDPGPP